MPYRVKGRFVKASNPAVVITRANARVAAERANAAQRATVARRSHGYRGPLTRADMVR